MSNQFCWKWLWLNPCVLISSQVLLFRPHFVHEEVWRRQQEPEWDVLGLSSRSYLLSWQPMGHHTTKKGKIYRACVQSVVTYGTETWVIKDGNLHSLERTEWMMVRWVCRVSLKDRKTQCGFVQSIDVANVQNVLYNLWKECILPLSFQ